MGNEAGVAKNLIGVHVLRRVVDMEHRCVLAATKLDELQVPAVYVHGYCVGVLGKNAGEAERFLIPHTNLPVPAFSAAACTSRTAH